MVTAGNDTEVDELALPTGMYYDWREVCRQVKRGDKLYLLPIYRKKSRDYHEEVRGGEEEENRGIFVIGGGGVLTSCLFGLGIRRNFQNNYHSSYILF